MNLRNIIPPIVICAAAYVIVGNEGSWILWGDSSKYIDMASGLTTVEPWSNRPLIPFLAGVFSDMTNQDIAHSFYYLNIGFFAIAGLTLLYRFGLLTALVTMTCTYPASLIFGKALLDSAVFMAVAVSLFLIDGEYMPFVIIWTTISAALHPMAFALCMVVLAFAAYEQSSLIFPFSMWYLVLPAVVFLAFFLPSTYSILLIPDLNDLLYSLKVLNVLWLGLFFLRKDKESFLLLLLLGVCLFFVPFLTMPARAFTPLALVLGPRLVEQTIGWYV